MALTSPLQTAIGALSISDVVLKSINAEISEGSESQLPENGIDLSLQHVLPRSIACKTYLPADANAKDHRKVVYEMLAGVRILTPRDGGFDNAPPDVIEAHVCATITCAFLVSYAEDKAEGKDFIDQEALDEFGVHNAPFNVWPYWREVAQSACSRMGLPRIVLPPYRLKKAATTKNSIPALGDQQLTEKQ